MVLHPLLQFKENPPKDDPLSGGEDESSGAQTAVALQHVLRKLGSGWKAEHGAGSWGGAMKPGSVLFPPVSRVRGAKAGKTA